MQVNNYKFLIPVSPDSVNTVIQYGKREGDIVALKKKWEHIAMTFIDEAIDEGTLPERFNGRISIFFALYFSVKRNRDGDNYTAMCKGILDAFVVKHLVKDDNSKFVDDDGRRLRVDQERPRVEVFIKEKIEDGSLVGVGDESYPSGDLVPINYDL